MSQFSPAAYACGHLTCFSFGSLTGCQICVMPLALIMLLLSLMICLSTLSFPFYHVMHGLSLKIKIKTGRTLTQTGGFILDFVVDRSANYNIITKEEKDPKAHQSVSVVVYFKSHLHKQNPLPFIGKVATKYTGIMKLHFCIHKSYTWCIPPKTSYP